MDGGASLSNSGKSVCLAVDPGVFGGVPTGNLGVLAEGILPVNSMSLGEYVVCSSPNIILRIIAQCANVTNAVNKSRVNLNYMFLAEI